MTVTVSMSLEDLRPGHTDSNDRSVASIGEDKQL